MNDRVTKKLEALFKIYKKNLPDKIHQIEALWIDLQQHWDLIKFKDFHREVHSLCGSAGTCGYSELSKAARQMVLTLKTVLTKEAISKADQEKISLYMNQLKLIQTSEKPKMVSYLDTKPSKVSENKSIFIMEQNKHLVKRLSKSLKQIGYLPHHIQDIITLRMAVKEQAPSAMIMDTHYLDTTSIQQILDIQKELTSPISLFCILPNAELLPRLMAIRAGCDAFFQKPIDVSDLTQVLNYKCSVVPGKSYRILIIDDSKPLADYYALVLNQAGMKARAITNPMNLFKELDSFQPNLLLMDVYMPECTGFELVSILRQESRYTKIPIIFLSTEEDLEKKLYAISLGVDDFLTKPVSAHHLISAVRSRSKRASILNYYMITDSLTGLLNHSSILKQLEIQLKDAKAANVHLSFIMIDIDHFKKINDKFGHMVGDQVIKKISNLFLNRLRTQDWVGRYGGEEFAIILPQADLEDARKIVDKLRIQLSQIRFKAENTEFNVTFSAGVSCLDGSNDIQSIIKQADQALYQAKQMGRNQVVVYN